MIRPQPRISSHSTAAAGLLWAALGAPVSEASAQPAFPVRADALPTSVFEVLGTGKRTRDALYVKRFCGKLEGVYKRYKWGTSPCLELPWRFDRVSERGEPLVYWEFNSVAAPGAVPLQMGSVPVSSLSETTLVLGGVHPDEITPVHLVFAFARSLAENPALYRGRRVIVAPLVNPDGMFVFPPKRTNANGIDLNRNFPTQDWFQRASHKWKQRKLDPRHFPGFSPHTEEGTRFQADLIGKFEPDKLITVHAPLGFFDYDGPGDEKRSQLSEHERRARELASLLSRTVRNYKVVDYGFFPGSLGNFSGNERAIPTVTLELASTNPRLVDKYWKEFQPALLKAVNYEFRRRVLASLETPDAPPASLPLPPRASLVSD